MALALREERDTGHQRAGKVDFFDYEALAQSVPHHRGSGGGVCGISEEREVRLQPEFAYRIRYGPVACRVALRATVAPPRSAVYVFHVDPRAHPRHTSVGVDAESLWSTTPAAAASKPAKACTTHVSYDTPSEKGARNVTALTSLGDKFAEKAEKERREVVRKAVGSAVKQVRALGEGVHGQTVFVDASADPRAADALYYGSTTFKLHTTVDVATLTGYTRDLLMLLADVLIGVSFQSDERRTGRSVHQRIHIRLWQELDRAGAREHDRFWRMPLDEYGPQVHSSNADLSNVRLWAAARLRLFVDGVEPGKDGATAGVRWAHLDIAWTMEQDKGLTGRPTCEKKWRVDSKTGELQDVCASTERTETAYAYSSSSISPSLPSPASSSRSEKVYTRLLSPAERLAMSAANSMLESRGSSRMQMRKRDIKMLDIL
ncbi:predicted protein [Postia placenta Mad-698-R]|nr:predicted protein [Postia placenta Mad-698-R]